MKLTFLGGADEVGASCTLVEMAGKKILVDAGIRISPKSSRGLQDDQLPHLAHLSDIGGPDVILITHAHTDHTGALPQVVRSYPRVPVYATAATIALSRVLLLDSSRLMEGRFEEEGELPLYDHDDVERLFERWQPLEFKKAHKLASDLQVTFHPSGHIAGAAMIAFESTEGVLVMGGDDSISPQRTVVKAQPPRIRADALVLESTYGGRAHANRKYEEQRLIDTIKEVTDNGGKVLIPAFALGRAQEVIQILLAYRDQLNVPVYVDGMVRAVCDAYSQFKDILPRETVKKAGNRPLFFRENVHPVKSKQEREDIARRTEPCIVVASSGMLTGGASVKYAAAFASDEKNAIFLTGYQDEESPGRFLQNVMRRKDRGEVPILQLGEHRVPLKCHLGTYSLSAHADEAELVGIAEALDAQRVFLVHGDTEARDSLWDTLKGKKRFVSRPKVGQEKHVEPRRQIAYSEPGAGQTVIPEALWRMLHAHQGEEFTARELAQVWYGDVERSREVIETLQEDNIYFSTDWRTKKNFTVKKKWQVEKAIRSEQVMRENRDIAGNLIVMRNINNQPRLCVVQSVTVDGFTGIMQGGKATNHDGEQFVWSLGPWIGEEDDNTKLQLSQMMTRAEAAMEQVMPYNTRQLLAAKEGLIQPAEYVTPLPTPLPEGEEGEKLYRKYQVELAAVVLVLARDGATYEKDGLKLERALPSGPVNQQVARDVALKKFPDEARLRKVGMLAHKNTLILNFDFPEAARDNYRELIEAVKMETGWEANIRMTTNQQALAAAVSDVLPFGIRPMKTPSLFMDQKEVVAEVEGVSDEDITKAEEAYYHMTHYKLRLVKREDLIEEGEIEGVAAVPTSSDGEPLEINAAYAVLKAALGPKGLEKAGQKGNEILLTFISPQVAARHTEEIEKLAEQVGYPLRVHEYPMQNLIMDMTRSLIRRMGWTARKGPGIHTDRGEVSVKLVDDVSDEDVARVSEMLEEVTGYKLILR